MLACGLDVRITFDKPLTAFSAFVAVAFTFVAISSPYVSEAIESSSTMQNVIGTGREMRRRLSALLRGSHVADVEAGGYVSVSTTSDAGDDSHAQQEGQVESDNDDPDQLDPASNTRQQPSNMSAPLFSVEHRAQGSAEQLDLPFDRPPPSGQPSSALSPACLNNAPVRPGPSALGKQRTVFPLHDESLESLSTTDDSSSDIGLGDHSHSNSHESGSNTLSSTTTTSSHTFNEHLHSGLSREARMRIKAQATDRPIPQFGWRYWLRRHYKAITVLMVIRAAVWALAIVFMHYSGKLHSFADFLYLTGLV